MTSKTNQLATKQRIRRIRARIFGTPQRPRLVVEKTNAHFRAQAIDDTTGTTLFAASDHEIESANPTAAAGIVGKLLAQKAQKAKIAQAVLDRRGHKYHGLIKSFAEAVRAEGIKI